MTIKFSTHLGKQIFRETTVIGGLVQFSYDVRNQPAIRRPVEVFKRCPACESDRLIPIADDAMCADCDWDSVELYAEVLSHAEITKSDLRERRLWNQ